MAAAAVPRGHGSRARDASTTGPRGGVHGAVWVRRRPLALACRAAQRMGAAGGLAGVLRERLTAKWRCALWLLVALRLCLPVSFASAVSVYNLWPHHLGGVSAAGTEAAAVNLATFIPESQSRSPVLVSATVHPAGLTPEPVVSGGDPVPAPGLAAAFAAVARGVALQFRRAGLETVVSIVQTLLQHG